MLNVKLCRFSVKELNIGLLLSLTYACATLGPVTISGSCSSERSVAVAAVKVNTVDCWLTANPGLTLISLKSSAGISIITIALFTVVVTSPRN